MQLTQFLVSDGLQASAMQALAMSYTVPPVPDFIRPRKHLCSTDDCDLILHFGPDSQEAY